MMDTKIMISTKFARNFFHSLIVFLIILLAAQSLIDVATMSLDFFTFAAEALFNGRCMNL